jgi:hypothetical protein
LTTGDLVQLSSSEVGCASNQINQKNSKYRYSWENTPILATSPVTPEFNQDAYFGVYLWYNSAWYEFERFLLNKTLVMGFSNYTLPSGHYDNLTGNLWIAFGLIASTDVASLSPVSTNTFDIIITEIS